MTKPDGGRLDVALLRPVAWLEEAASVESEPCPSRSGCDTRTDETPGTGETPVAPETPQTPESPERLVGATVYLDLPELGAEGPAEVVLVEPCPAIGPPPAEGCRIVTGTFAHAAGNVVDLTVEGLDEPIGTTANHPFWSEDRQAFIPAGELRQGETLRTAAGDLRRVARVAARGTTEPVHNLEVDAEHVYYVTSDGLLVHNAYHANDLRTTKPAKGYTLRSTITNRIRKYGETTRGASRYSKKWLAKHKLKIHWEGKGTKAQMHKWQHDRILRYKARFGRRPDLNKNDW